MDHLEAVPSATAEAWQEATGLASKRPRIADNTPEAPTQAWAKPSVGTWMHCKPRARPQASVVGTWHYGTPTKTYKIRDLHGKLVFEERPISQGELIADGDWLVATLTKPCGEAHGRIRLRYDAGKIVSAFRKKDEMWGDDVIATNEADIISGVWSYIRSPGGELRYDVRHVDGKVLFVQALSEGKQINGELVVDGDWRVAKLTTGSAEEYGTIRLQYQAGRLMSNFAAPGSSWGEDVTATKVTDKFDGRWKGGLIKGATFTATSGTIGKLQFEVASPWSVHLTLGQASRKAELKGDVLYWADGEVWPRLETIVERGDRIQALPGQEDITGGVEYYKAGDKGTAVEVKQERCWIIWERTRQKTGVLFSTFASHFKIIGKVDFIAGDIVEVKPSIKNPKYGWGSVRPGERGVVKSYLEPEKMKVDFPSRSDWTAQPSEMQHIQANYQPGDRVEGLYRNNQWYDATVDKINGDGTFTLGWADNDSRDKIKRKEHIRMLPFTDDDLKQVMQISHKTASRCKEALRLACGSVDRAVGMLLDGRARPATPGKPTLTIKDQKLEVRWTIPDSTPTVTFTSVKVRGVGDTTWQLVDTCGGRNMLVPSGGGAVSAPTCSIVINSLENGKSYEAAVVVRNSEGWGNDSPPSDSIMMPASSAGKLLLACGANGKLNLVYQHAKGAVGLEEAPQESSATMWSVMVEIDQGFPFDLVWPAMEDGVLGASRLILPTFHAMGWDSRAQLVDTLGAAVQASGYGAIARGLQKQQAEQLVELLCQNISCSARLDLEGAKAAAATRGESPAAAAVVSDTNISEASHEKVWSTMISVDPGFPFRDAWGEIEKHVHEALVTVANNFTDMGWTCRQDMHTTLQEAVEASGVGPIARCLEQHQAERVANHLKQKMPSLCSVAQVDRKGAETAGAACADGRPSLRDSQPAKLTVIVERKRLLSSCVGALLDPSPKRLRPGNLHVKYAGEDGQDGGGVTRAFLAQAGGLLADPQLGLFLPAPDSQQQLHPMPGFFSQSGEDVQAQSEQWCRFLGRVLGMSIVHECPLGLSLVPPLCKQLLKQDPSFEDLRFVPGLSDGEAGWFQSLRSLLKQDSDLDFAMDIAEVDAALYGMEATMPSRAQQVFESFAKYVGDAAQSEEQWPIAIRMATRLLQESQSPLQSDAALSSAAALLRGIARARDVAVPESGVQTQAMANLSWSPPACPCVRRLSKKNIRFLKRSMRAQLPALTAEIVTALRSFAIVLFDLQLETTCSLRTASELADLLPHLVEVSKVKQAMKRSAAKKSNVIKSGMKSPKFSASSGAVFLADRPQLKRTVSGVEGDGIRDGEALSAANLRAYSAAVAKKALVDNLQPHLTHVVEEFRSVVPEKTLEELTWQQVQERISGKTLAPEAFRTLWQDRTCYKCCGQGDKPVQLWWDFVAQCSKQDLHQLFTWSTGFAAPPSTPWKFQVQVIEDAGRLPSVNTCLTDETSMRNRGVKMPTLYLPPYESMDVLRQAMKLATAGANSMAMHLH